MTTVVNFALYFIIIFISNQNKIPFYFIALKANVPIVVAYFDYGKKEVGTKGVFYPTGDVDKDIHTIREMYRGVTACHPENFVQV